MRATSLLLILLLTALPAGAAKPVPATAMLPVTWSAVATPRGGTLVVQVGAARVDVRLPSVEDARRAGPTLAARLSLVAATRASLSRVAAGTVGEAGVLLWDGRIVLMVTRAQARLSREEPLAVASRWAAALRRAAAATARPGRLPAVVHVPEGGTRLLALPTVWTGAAVSVSDPGVLQARGGSDLELIGREAGSAVVTLVKGKKSAAVEVRVREKAGVIPTSVTVALAGDAALQDPELALDALQRALEQSCQARPGAWLEPYWQGVAGRTAGGSRVTAWLEGPGLTPVVASVAVMTVASPHAFIRPQALAASNHPERLTGDQVLLDEPLSSGGNTVYYYHHQNSPGSPRRALEIRLENRTQRPMRLLVTQSGAGPSRDELYAGHIATWRYLRWMTRGKGWEVRIPPGGTYLLDRRVLDERDVSCGMGQVMVIDGTAPNLVAEAYDAGPTEYAETGEDDVPVPGQRPAVESIRGRGLYPRPEVEITQTYRVGGRHVFIAVGGPPYQQPLSAGGTPNTGNYGVEHRIRIYLENPSPEPVKLYLVFSVRGGLARGSLLVDDRLIETPMLSTKSNGKREFGLGEYEVAPGEMREINILAFPEPGSNYPIWLIVRPQPANG